MWYKKIVPKPKTENKTFPVTGSFRVWKLSLTELGGFDSLFIPQQ